MSDAVLISLIGGGVTVITALISIFAYYIKVRLARGAPKSPAEADELEAEEKYVNDPRAFISDIMEDRRQYREEVAGLREEAKGYREEVAGLRQELNAFRDKDRKFRNALARWLLDIADAWNMLDTMPYPRAGDRDLLEDVLPPALTRPPDV